MVGKKLFEKILIENSYRQDVSHNDSREMLRFMWFTRRNLLLFYEKWEDFLVERGYGRKATDEEYETRNKRVIWYKDQRSQAANGDEIRLALKHGDMNMGGREGSCLVSGLVQNNGVPTETSSTSCTLFHAAILMMNVYHLW